MYVCMYVCMYDDDDDDDDDGNCRLGSILQFSSAVDRCKEWVEQ